MFRHYKVTIPELLQIHVTVTPEDYTPNVISDSIKKLFSAMKTDVVGRKIVGLTLKKTFPPTGNTNTPLDLKTEAKYLVLCVENQCLIVNLKCRCLQTRILLANFLDFPHITFVGFGIEKDLALLERDFGFHCTKFVELGSLAAEEKEKPRLKDIGLSDLASFFMLKLPIEPADVLLCFQDDEELNKTAIEYAARDAYACFFMGKFMLKYV